MTMLVPESRILGRDQSAFSADELKAGLKVGHSHGLFEIMEHD